MEYTVKYAIRMEEALFSDLWSDENRVVRYLLFYEADWDRETSSTSTSCKIRLGNRRFITLDHVVEGSMELAFFQKY